MQEPDPRSVDAARRGDLSAFEELVRVYQGDVWRLCFQLVREEALADDATQEAFVKVFRFLPRFRGDSKFTTWLFSITRNCAMDELRRAQRRRRTAERVISEPQRQSQEIGTALEVREAVAELPPSARESVVLIDMFGLSYKEAAEICGVPVGTIKSRVHQARRLLARSLLEGEKTGEI
jgi:RNA polymerase sigma-70 factor (ECF subfamily)